MRNSCSSHLFIARFEVSTMRVLNQLERQRTRYRYFDCYGDLAARQAGPRRCRKRHALIPILHRNHPDLRRGISQQRTKVFFLIKPLVGFSLTASFQTRESPYDLRKPFSAYVHLHSLEYPRTTVPESAVFFSRFFSFPRDTRACLQTDTSVERCRQRRLFRAELETTNTPSTLYSCTYAGD